MAEGFDIKISENLLKKIEKVDNYLVSVETRLKEITDTGGRVFDPLMKSFTTSDKGLTNINSTLKDIVIQLQGINSRVWDVNANFSNLIKQISNESQQATNGIKPITISVKDLASEVVKLIETNKALESSLTNDSEKTVKNNTTKQKSFEDLRNEISKVELKASGLYKELHSIDSSKISPQGNTLYKSTLDQYEKLKLSISAFYALLDNLIKGNAKLQKDEYNNLVKGINNLVKEYKDASTEINKLKSNINTTQPEKRNAATTTGTTKTETKTKSTNVETQEQNAIEKRLTSLKEELALLEKKRIELVNIQKESKHSSVVTKFDYVSKERKDDLAKLTELKNSAKKLEEELTKLQSNINQRGGSNKQESIQKQKAVAEDLKKIYEEIDKRQRIIDNRSDNYNNLKNQLELHKQKSAQLDEELKKVNQEYETTLRQVQALEQLNKINKESNDTKTGNDEFLSTEEEIKKRSEANRKYYEEQEKLAQKEKERQQKEEEKARARQQKEAEKQQKEEERKAIAYEKRKQQVLNRWYSSSPNRALKYSSNAKTLEEETKAVKYLIAARNKLSKEDKNYKSTVENLNKAIKQHIKNIKDTTGATQTFNKLQANATGLAQQLRRNLLMAFSISQLKGYLNNLIAIRGEFELQQRSLEAILQNKDKANEIWDKTISLAVQSPFTIKELVSYTKQLASYRIETEKLYDTNKMLADISAGLGVDMQRLILAYGQVKAANYLRGTELRQFSEAGINILGELAKYFSEIEQRTVSVGEVFEMVSKRMVSFQDVDTVLQRITSEGGVFYNMQQIQAMTLKGMISNLRDSLDIMINDIGKANEDVIKGSIESLRIFMVNWEKWYGVVMPFLTAFMARWLLIGVITGKNTIAMINFIKSMALLRKEITGVKSLFSAIGIAGGGQVAIIKGIITLITLLISLLVVLYNKLKFINKLTKELNKSQLEFTTEFHLATSEYKRLTDIIRDNTKSYQEQQSALLKLQQQYGDILPEHLKEYNAIRNNANAYKEATEAINDYYKAKAMEEGQKIVDEYFSGTITEKTSDITKAIKKLFKKMNVDNADQRSMLFAQSLISEYSTKKGVNVRDMLVDYLGVNDYTEEEIDTYINVFEKQVKKVDTAMKEYIRVVMDYDTQISKLSSRYYAENITTSFKEMQGNQQDITNNIIKNLEIIKKYINGDTTISEALFDQAKKYNKKWYEDIFNEDIDYDKIAKDVWEFESTVLKIRENASNNFIKKLKDSQSRAKDKERPIWQTFIDQETINLSQLSGTKLQKEARRVAKLISDEYGIAWEYVNSLIPSESITKDEFAKSIKAQIDDFESVIGQYEIDLTKKANFAPFDPERIEKMKAILPMLKEFYTYFYVDDKKNNKTDIFAKQLEVLKGMYEKYQELIKTFGEEYSSGATIEAFADAFKEAFGFSFKQSPFGEFFKNSGLYEDALDKLAQTAKTLSNRMKVFKEKGRIGFEIDVKLRKKTDEELNAEIDKLFSDYENLIELRSLGVSDKFAKAFFDIDTISLQDVRQRVEMELSNLEFGEDEINKLKDYLKKVTELENKELNDRLKEYIKFTRESISEKAKLKYQEYLELLKVEETFNKKIQEAQDEEQQKILEDAKDRAIQGVKNETLEKINQLEWESIKNSEIMINMFGDLQNVGGIALDTMIKKLEDSKVAWSNLPLNEMKEVIKLLENLKSRKEDIQIQSNPFKEYAKLSFELKGQNPQTAQQNIVNESETIIDYETKISELDLIIQKIEEGADATQELNSYNDKYGASLTKDVTLLKNIRNQHQNNINISKQNIKNNEQTLEKFRQQKKALSAMSEALNNIQSTFKSLIDPIQELYELTSDDDGIAGIWMEMAGNMGDAVMNAIQLQINTKIAKIQLQEAGVQAKAFGYAMNTAMGVIGWIVMAIQLIVEGIKAVIAAHDKKLEVQIEQWANAIERLERAYEKLEAAIDNAMNFSDYNKLQKSLIDNLEKQIDLTEKSLKAEEDKKKKDEDQIQEYKDQIEDLKEDLDELKEKRIEALGGFGSDENIKDAAQELIDAWIDAYKEGEDQIDALNEKWDEFINNLTKKQVFYTVAKKYLDNVLRQVDSYLEDSVITNEEIASISDLAKQSSAELNTILTSLMDSLGITAGTLNSELEGLSKSKIELTEDTGQAIEAILNSSRFYIIQISNNIQNIYDHMLNSGFDINPIISELRMQTGYIEDIKNYFNSVIDRTSMNPTIRVKI
ncbi:MAG: tape measure protein [Anaeroplasma sp.]